MSEQDDPNAPKVEIYKRSNVLKGKVGLHTRRDMDGQLDPEKVDQAEGIIKAMCKDCNKSIGEELEKIIRVWVAMATLEMGAKREEKAQEIFTFAHEIKDISALCGYELAAHFAESLRDYVVESTYDLKHQRIIVQAHIDALILIHKNNIKDDAGAVAEELKQMVKLAIDKYK
jgi:AraC-like DNA-binding protein|tara:strand:+ start:187172 stop:187690 length:519 start_codon:yes stop_codon:yes gene_type:complete